MNTTPTMQVAVETHGRVPEEAKELAAEKVGALLRLVPEPVLSAHVMLASASDPAIAHPALATATADVSGRVVRAQAAGQWVLAAIDEMEPRLRVRLERGTWHRAAMRGTIHAGPQAGWRHLSIPAHRLPYVLREAGERAVICRASYAARSETAAEAAAELDLLDYDFHLFSERSTGQDSALYRAAGGYRLAMAIPQLGRLGPVPELIAVSKLPAPRLTIREAITRLEAMGQPFTLFTDSRTGRGSIMYHRYDGHYGLIVPAGTDDGLTGPDVMTGSIGGVIRPAASGLRMSAAPDKRRRAPAEDGPGRALRQQQG